MVGFLVNHVFKLRRANTLACAIHRTLLHHNLWPTLLILLAMRNIPWWCCWLCHFSSFFDLWMILIERKDQRVWYITWKLSDERVGWRVELELELELVWFGLVLFPSFWFGPWRRGKTKTDISSKVNETGLCLLCTCALFD